MKKLLFSSILLLFLGVTGWGQSTIAQFNFPATSSLVVSSKDANVSVSNFALSAGTIETNITTGTYFPNEPYIEESGGWTAATQATAKNYTFTITALSGYQFSITNISFRAYATSAGPSGFGFAIGSTDIYSVNAPDASLITVNQSVSGQTNLTAAIVKIQGWLNGSRTSAGSGAFRLDDVIITGVVSTTGAPTKLAITSISPSSPIEGSAFNVTVQAQDDSNNPSNVTSATDISLSKATGTGTLGGTLTGQIANGSSSVTISGVTFDTPGTGISLSAETTAGMSLTSGTSNTFTVLATTPTSASSVLITSRTVNSIGISWTNGNGIGRIVVARLNSSAAVAPTNGTTYTSASSSFSDGTNPTTGTGNVVVYNGTDNSLTITGLSAATAYNFDVYEYNGSTSTYNYAGAASAGSTSTLATEPTTQASSITISSVTATGMTIGWTSGNGSNRIVLVKASGTVDSNPVDGTPYTASTTFGSGTQIGTGNYVVYVSTGSSVTITGLTSNTTYFIAVYEFNGSSTTINYLTSSSLTGNRTTIPTVASAVTVTAKTSSSMDLGWVNGNGTGRILVARIAPNGVVTPSYGTTYNVNSTDINDPLNGTTGTGNVVVYNGTGNSVTVTGLTAATQYQYYVYEYNSGSNYSAAASSAATYSLANEPSSPTTAIVFSGITATGMTIGFTKGDGANRLVLVRSGGSVNSDPVDGTTYTANTSFGSGTQIGTGNYVVYGGTGSSVSVTNLSANSTYYVAVYEFNGSGATSNFYLSTPATGNQITLVAAPSAPSSLSFGSVTYNSFTSSFTAPVSAPAGYLVLRRAGSAVTGTPIGGTVYSQGQTNIGSGINEVTYVGASAWTAYAQTGLIDNTAYYYAIYSYAGETSQTNYSSALTGSQTTSTISAPTSSAATNLSTTGFDANWSAISGASSGYQLDVSTSSTFSTDSPATLTEGFESGLSSSGYYTGTLTLSSGSWSFVDGGLQNVDRNTGTYSCQLKGSTGTATTPALNGIGTITFYAKSPNSSTTLTVKKIVSGVTSTIATKSVTGSWSQFSVDVNENNSSVQIIIANGSNYALLDDVSIGYIGSAPFYVTGYNAKPISGQATTSSIVSGLTPNETYYYRVRSVGGNSTSANSGTINVTTNAAAASNYSGTGNWSEAANWSAGKPGAITDVIINGSLTIDDLVDCNNITIPYNGSVTVGSGQGLSVNGNLLIESTASGTGSFISASDDYTVTGTSTVQRYVPAATWTDWKDGWHALSSPVSAQAVSGFTEATAADYDIYSWYEPGNVWVNYKNTDVAPTWNTANTITNGLSNDPANFLVGKGYLVSYKNNVTKSFVGNLNTSDVSITGLDISGAGSNSFHLLGNPFPSAILWDAGWTKSNIAATAQVWSEALQDYTSVVYGDYIPSMNGFIVEATSDGASLTIPAAKRAHNATSWYKNQTANLQLLKLTILAADGGSGKETIIRFDPMSTTAFDKEYDGSYLQGYGPVFYSNAGDLQLSVNTLPSLTNNTEIPLTFVRNQATDFELLAEGLETIPADVYLNDMKTGTSQNLRLNPVYSFNSSDSDSPDRFKLTFGAVGIGESENQNSLQAYVYGNRVYVTNTLGKAMMQLFDLQGRLVLSSQLNGNGIQSQALNFPDGVYVLRLSNTQIVKSEKVVIGE